MLSQICYEEGCVAAVLIPAGNGLFGSVWLNRVHMCSGFASKNSSKFLFVAFFFFLPLLKDSLQ